jgi:hypothetical protein
MENMKNYIVSSIVTVLSVAVAFMLFQQTPVTTTVLGGSSSPSIVGGCTEIEGVRTCYRKSSLAIATTTVCALKSPIDATSTLRRALVRFSVGSTTASTVYVSKAATAFATTTSLGYYALAANAQGTFQATTTSATILDQNGIFAPGTYLVVGMAGGTGTFSPTGACEAIWDTI